MVGRVAATAMVRSCTKLILSTSGLQFSSNYRVKIHKPLLCYNTGEPGAVTELIKNVPGKSRKDGVGKTIVIEQDFTAMLHLEGGGHEKK